MTTSTTRSIHKLLIALTVTAAVSGAAPALAGDDLPSITVKYGDLNLGNREGAEMLYRRIQRAAAKVCQYEHRAPLPDIVRICYDMAVANAVAHVNSAPLQAVHQRKSGTAQS